MEETIIDKYYREAVQGIQSAWLIVPGPEWYDHIIGLPLKIETTYMIVILHNQVINGGFHQYFVNGYGQFAGDTVEGLRLIGANKKSEFLRQALIIVNDRNLSQERFREVLLTGENRAVFKDENIQKCLDVLDDQYDAVDDEEDIETLLKAYLG